VSQFQSEPPAKVSTDSLRDTVSSTKILNKAGQLTYEKFKKRAVDLYSELETLQDFYQKARLESQLTKRTEGDFRDFLVEALISSEEDLRQVAQEYHELYPQ
jgi:hypothetical protein